MGLQLLMPPEVSSSSGGRYSGIYLLLELMRSTQRLLHLTLRLVFWDILLLFFYWFCYVLF